MRPVKNDAVVDQANSEGSQGRKRDMNTRSAMMAVTIALFAAAGGPASAAVVASSNFTAGDDGWRVGEFQTVVATSAPTFDPVNGVITTTDLFGYNAFVAPAAYLGNQLATFGGSITFQLSDSANDNTAYSPLTLRSGTTTYYALPSVVPSTNALSLTTYTINLIGANFRPSDLGSGPAVTDAELQTVLSSLDLLAINADWRTGEDFVTLDNVALRSLGNAGVVPEPSVWAMMIIGFGAAGSMIRRRKAVVA